MRYVVLFATLFYFCIADSSQAAFKSGNDLLKDCESQSGYDQVHCMGYITAVSDAESFFDQYGGVSDYVCLPPGVTAGQLRDVVVKYLREHPEMRHYSASDLVLVALGINFRCE